MFSYILVGSVIHFILVSWGMTSEIEKESFEQWPFWPTVKSIFSCGNKLFIARETTFISAVEKHHYLFPGWKWPQKWNKCVYLKLPYYQFASCPWCRREGWVVPIITCWEQAMQIHVGPHHIDAPGISALLGPQFKVVQNFRPKNLLPSSHSSSLPCFHWPTEFLLLFCQIWDLSLSILKIFFTTRHFIGDINTFLLFQSLPWFSASFGKPVVSKTK